MRIAIIGASTSEPQLVELLDEMYVCTICGAVNQLQLLFLHILAS